MLSHLRNFFWSDDFGPVLNITCIWLAALTSMLSFVDNQPELGFIWSLCAYLNGLTYYYNKKINER